MIDRAVLYVGDRNLSSWSIRASLLVRQGGLPCDEQVIFLNRPDTRARILEVSPSGLVPVLVWGELRIWDSLAIAEFLHERYPDAGIWPADIGRRARARSVSAEIHSGFTALRKHCPMHMRDSKPMVKLPAEVRTDVARIEAIWNTCLAESDGDYLFGEWCAADAFYAPVVSRFRTYGMALGTAAEEYAQAVWNWPAMADLLREAEAEP